MRAAFIGYGEVACAFSSALAGKGVQISAYDVLVDRPGGIERLRERASGVDVSFCTLKEAVTGAAYVLSTVTTSVALQAARASAAHLGNGQTYVDFNATNPSTKVELEHLITPTGAAFVEGAVLGAVGVTGAKTEILLGGPHGRRAERDLGSELGLNVRFYSEEIGKASMFKNLRSVFSKGLEALLVEFLVAGERAGIRADLWREVTELMANHPFDKTAANWVRTHASAHARRHHEMQQVAEVLRELGVEPTITDATVAFFERSGHLRLEPTTATGLAGMDEVIKMFNERLPGADSGGNAPAR
jgi:3-hydroxyisobutyrate dehydrogenase-like beta-hydroxyacid dehydrogenase